MYVCDYTYTYICIYLHMYTHLFVSFICVSFRSSHTMRNLSFQSSQCSIQLFYTTPCQTVCLQIWLFDLASASPVRCS